MILIKPSFVIETPIRDQHRDNILKLIEAAGRTCYKSECKITENSASEFVRRIVQVKKHESVIEHVGATVRFIVDRGVTHEMVRHRIAAFSQESTRYVNYSGEKTDGHCQFIIPPWCSITAGTYIWDAGFCGLRDKQQGLTHIEDIGTINWLQAMQDAEDAYMALIKNGWSPQQARSVLPNSTKTEIVMTANMREWRHVFRMRCAPSAHPQMREVMCPLLIEFQAALPELFGDIVV